MLEPISGTGGPILEELTMPCKTHMSYGSDCKLCLQDALLTFKDKVAKEGISGKTFTHIEKVQKFVDTVREKGELAEHESDLLQVMIAEINGALLGHDPGMKKLLEFKLDGDWLYAPPPGALITEQYRTGYRRYVREDGNWIGMSEFQFLCRHFQVNFDVYVVAPSTTRSHHVTCDNPKVTITGRCLVFTVNHWEVGMGSSSPFQVLVQTNPYGNCGLEAFLTTLALADLTQRNLLDDPLRQWVNRFRTLRQGTRRATDAVSARYADKITQEIRAFLADNMTDDDVDDALHAIPGLCLGEATLSGESSIQPTAIDSEAIDSQVDIPQQSGGKSRKKGELWNDYLAHVRKYFTLTQALKCRNHTAGQDTFVYATNIDLIAPKDLLKHCGKRKTVSEALNNYEQPILAEDNGTKSAGRSLAHLGFMVATIVHQGGTDYVYIVIANFAAGRRTTKHPYQTKGTNALPQSKVEIPKQTSLTRTQNELFSAADMHTECYSYFLLDKWLEGVQGVTRIDIEFVLAKNMCPRCLAAKELFEAKHAVQETRPHSRESNDDFPASDALATVNQAVRDGVDSWTAWNPFK